MEVSRLTLCALLVATALAPHVASAEDWQRIDAAASFVDTDGVFRTPACSGSPRLEEGEVVATDTDYAFFVRDGDPARLLLFFDGGGACWDAGTCIDAALDGDVLYYPEVDETPAELAGFGGVFDIDRDDNPLRDHLQVYLPYCTGDLHLGARDTSYPLPDGGDWTIYHRGHDNVIAVLEYLADYYANEVGEPPEEIVLVGASAGGYGVLYNYPALARRFPGVERVRVLVDSSNGVISEDLFERALEADGVWGAQENLDPEIASAFDDGAGQLVPGLLNTLGWQYPDARFGQYTRAYDAVQVLFFNVSSNLGNPERWFDPVYLLLSGLEWTTRARASMWGTAFTTWNYRFYLAQGQTHMVSFYDDFFSEDSAGGIELVDWFSDMIERRWTFGSDWRNASCVPACLPPEGLDLSTL
ncbi:pectin acetylesterase-family hydrolase [Marichromatium gracile]|uniref:Pectinacetylesterase n=1 Tax=Marichromatium gracile TaxID=1048 RepID=A0A4R4A4V9_MARGR|nr:pectin acetylesterase-family hydrolase [Marichromatium gracile]MBK1709472.1 hypothetical protein [Marichromatium gracile]TCW33205.1 pectinacetylesterase [Marichromatium gracile]